MFFIILLLISSITTSCSVPEAILARKRAMTPPPRLVMPTSPLFSRSNTHEQKQAYTQPTNVPTETNSFMTTTDTRSPLTPNFQMSDTLPQIKKPENNPQPTSTNVQTQPDIRFPDGYEMTREDLRLVLTKQAQLQYEPRVTINLTTLSISGYWICSGLLLANGTTRPLTKTRH